MHDKGVQTGVLRLGREGVWRRALRANFPKCRPPIVEADHHDHVLVGRIPPLNQFKADYALVTEKGVAGLGRQVQKDDYRWSCC